MKNFCDNQHAAFKQDKELREQHCTFIGFQEDVVERLALWNCPFHEVLIGGKMQQHPATFSVVEPKLSKLLP